MSACDRVGHLSDRRALWRQVKKAELAKSEKRLSELLERTTKRETDAVFHINEEEKQRRRKDANKTVQDFLVEQTVSGVYSRPNYIR